MHRRLFLLLSSALTLLVVAPAAGATTYVVTTTADTLGGSCLPGSCSVRQAVTAANAGGGDTIEIPAGEYKLALGQLPLLKDVTITGAGSATTALSGNEISRVFEVTPTTTATIADLAVEKGRVTGTGAGQAHGGGILNLGTLILQSVRVHDNAVLPAEAGGSLPEGGGIFNSSILQVIGSEIDHNRATMEAFAGGIPSGGGIANQGGLVEIANSTISANLTETKQGGIPSGGGLSSSAPLAHGAVVTLTGTTLSGNEARIKETGGIAAGGGFNGFRTDLTVVDSSVAGNRAIGGAIADGGGIYFIREGDLTLERSLVAENVAESGLADGAGLLINGETEEEQRIVNSTIARNSAVATSPAGSVQGSAIFHFGGARLDVLSSTVSGNTSTSAGTTGAGAAIADGGVKKSLLVLRDSIVSGGSAAPASGNCEGAGVQSAGHNIDSLDQCNFTGTGDKVNTDPLLAPLAANGGPTRTQALEPRSPAIDAGSDCPATDQRGVERPQGTDCDIGAFELVLPAPPAPPAATGKAERKRPQLGMLPGRVKIDLKTGRGTAQAHCFADAGDSCAVALNLFESRRGKPKATASKRPRKLGSASARIPGGGNGSVTFKLGRKGLAMLGTAKGLKLRVRALGASTGRSGEAAAVDQKLTLKGKAASKPKA